MAFSTTRLIQRTTQRPHLLIFPALGLFILIYLLSPSNIQLPAFLPSHPNSRTSSPQTLARLSSISSQLSQICPSSPTPLYPNATLTPTQETRYRHLTLLPGHYLLVTITKDISPHLPDLLNTILILITYLGASKLSFSFLEGPSSDCTPNALTQILIPLLLDLGVPSSRINIQTNSPKIDFDKVNRIGALADLRNQALEPLWRDLRVKNGRVQRGGGGNVEAVVFLNDVFLRAGDVLEVMHQHFKAGSGITTGWDWYDKGPDYYYDIWVGRTVDTGDLFYPIDQTWFSPSTNLFANSPEAHKSFTHLQPFQVYSSWNALAVMDPTPFLPPYNVRFRRGNVEEGECSGSECSLICQDYWKEGWGKVLVVPSVQLAYDPNTARQTIQDMDAERKKLGWIDGVPPLRLDKTVKFDPNPPERVRCHPWPETYGLSANVWETTRWVDPWTGKD